MRPPARTARDSNRADVTEVITAGAVEARNTLVGLALAALGGGAFRGEAEAGGADEEITELWIVC